MVLIQSWPPHLALAPIAQADPPYMPFRDAGYSQADFVLGIQDVVYGVWKAKEEGLCGLRDFDLEEYELYERVDMGDFNWITPNFIAFASPQLPSQSVAPIARDAPAYAALPSTISGVVASSLPLPLKNVLVHFKERDVGLVVRLNSELYCPTYFSALGITHLDMIFEDGTCPPLPLVKKFIELAHETITVHRKSIAVHCKAGLGRTGCLIGAYLIYRHGFTAHEVISFMRFMRPGMVVGPQQHWLHLNQGTFREWWVEEVVREKVLAQVAAANAASAQAAAQAAAQAPVTPARGMKQRLVILTPSAEEKAMRNGNAASAGAGAGARSRAALNEIDNEAAASTTTTTTNTSTTAAASTSPHKHYTEDYLPAPTPGQPRKTHRRDSRNHPYARAVSGSLAPRSEELTASGRRRKVSSSLAYLASQSPSPSAASGCGSPSDRVSPSPSPTIAEELVPARSRESGRESPSPSPSPGNGGDA
ncbi:cell division control protein 14 [Ascosphaera pollenicola]|nr:cell division control protein 14 [Ascosphaera pollenicola]